MVWGVLIQIQNSRNPFLKQNITVIKEKRYIWQLIAIYRTIGEPPKLVPSLSCDQKCCEDHMVICKRSNSLLLFKPWWNDSKNIVPRNLNYAWKIGLKNIFCIINTNPHFYNSTWPYASQATKAKLLWATKFCHVHHSHQTFIQQPNIFFHHLELFLRNKFSNLRSIN